MNRKGTLFVVTGPSGAGKGTVLARVLPEMDGIGYSISVTTRPPREGERDGVHYFFIGKADFEALIARNKLLEYAEYVGNYYGTPSDNVFAQIESGRDIVLEIEVQGALQVKKKHPEAVLIFIIPPSFGDLETRLRSRGGEKEDIIAMRLAKAKSEYGYVSYYDYIIVNDEVETAADELRSIIKATRCTTLRRKDLLT